MALQWSTTAAQGIENGLKFCVHGRSGAGKTRLIPTLPRPIVATVEGGTLSIATENIRCATVASKQDLDEFYDWVVGSAEAKNYDTVCVDSLTEVGDIILAEEKVRSKDPRKAYGEMQDMVMAQIRRFRDIKGKHVYFTAKTALQEQPDGSKLYSPVMPGQKLGAGLAFYFDEFFYLGIGTDMHLDPKTQTMQQRSFRFLQTNSNALYEAKDRSGALDEVEHPDLGVLITKIQSRIKNLPAATSFAPPPPPPPPMGSFTPPPLS
jgi:AAA domain